MIEPEARLWGLETLGLELRDRLVSGPQGPHVVVDGRPVLVLSSDNYLGLADHPRVRQAAADAAMRWGVGAGASRPMAGTMTVHRRLEERLAEFTRHESALLFGSGFLANAGVIPALARRGDVVFSDEGNHPSIVDGCRLSGADVFVYDHLDIEHLAWGLDRAEARGALIVTESLFASSGELAPLEHLNSLADHYGTRLIVDESHAIGTLGPGGRGAIALANLEGGADVVVGTLGGALGSYGGFAACDAATAPYLRSWARTIAFSTAPPPPAVAGALAALELLQERPELVAKVQANALALRRELGREGLDAGSSRSHVVPLVLGHPAAAARASELALAQGVFAPAIGPPAVPVEEAGLRLTVLASHRADELRWAARVVAGAVREAAPVLSPDEEKLGPDPERWEAYERSAELAEAPVDAGAFDLEVDAAQRPRAGIFDLEAEDRLAA